MNRKQLETHLFESARAVLNDLFAKGDSPLYTAAFHGNYREEERVLSPPFLGANSFATLKEADAKGTDTGFAGIKWNPADWEWNWAPSQIRVPPAERQCLGGIAGYVSDNGLTFSRPRGRA